MMKRNTTPQENKVRDYMNQTQNCYGGNDKSSRTAIRRRKAWVNKSFRRMGTNILIQISRVNDSCELTLTAQ